MTKARDLATSGPSTGLVHINTTAFSGALSHSFGSDASPIFTSDYRNYKVIIENANSTTSDQNIFFRLRANTTDLTSNSYEFQQFTYSSTTVGGGRNSNQSSFRLGTIGPGTVGSIIFDLTNPQQSVYKNIQSHNMWNENGVGPRIGFYYGDIFSSSAYNGFTIFASTNISGTISVYGYRN